jgi:hypothetical protein
MSKAKKGNKQERTTWAISTKESRKGGKLSHKKSTKSKKKSKGK